MIFCVVLHGVEKFFGYTRLPDAGGKLAMANLTAPVVECEKMHVTLPVSDLADAVEFYTTKLGFRLGFLWGEPAFFAGISLGEVEIFLREETPAPNAGAVVFMVGDADALYEFHLANGVEVVEPIEDREYGIRDYAVKDMYGYIGWCLSILSIQRGRRSRLSAWMFRCGWRGGWRGCCRIWRPISG